MNISLQPSPTSTRVYDVIVIGGGVNGTSAARELSIAGYAVLLAEQADFANGASGRSSRILHCGLRYFETRHPVRTFMCAPHRFFGAARMAKAAMEARAELVDVQPKHCKPFTMCFPLYRDGDVRGWHLDLGFALLKRMGPAEPSLDYVRRTADFDRVLPFAGDLRDRKDLLSIATYREYIMDWPDRFCVDAALTAERNGADIRLFTEARLGQRSSSGAWTVMLVDRHSGKVETVQAPIVLNMAGTWIDRVAGRGEGEASSPLVLGTKGAHIVVRLPDRYRGFGLATLHRGGMPFYCLPLDDDLFYFGPTETRYDGDATGLVTTDDDIAFLLAEANFLLPGLGLGRKNVEFAWSGVRPLTYDRDQPMGRRTREIHDLSGRGMPGIFAMTAGPVMSHRSAGRDMLRVVSRSLKPSRRVAISASLEACSTADFSSSDTAYRRAVAVEHARDLKGILYTRTGRGWGRYLDREMVAHAAASVADLLDWSAARAAAEVSDFMRYQETVYRAVPSPAISHRVNQAKKKGEGDKWTLHTH
ncbi:MAG: FAD-dependent oxidoreductase [Variibacter sp.]